jgi:mxaJ protein
MIVESYNKDVAIPWRRWTTVPLILVCLAADGTARRATRGTAATAPLRVCADPNNLPFSNERRAGVENRLAALVAEALQRPLEYVWWAQRRGFLRHTLNARLCDVVMGLPVGVDAALTTRPYYRSTYVFVTRSGDPPIRSLNDPALRRLRVGVPLVGDDGANPPPAQALARRGIIRNVVGFSVYGDYRDESPPSRLIDAVAMNQIDVAIAWGPVAGYFAARQHVPLQMSPVPQPFDTQSQPFWFDVAMAVRRDDTPLHALLDGLIQRRRAAIDALLREFHVPRVQPSSPDSVR